MANPVTPCKASDCGRRKNSSAMKTLVSVRFARDGCHGISMMPLSLVGGAPT